MLLVVLVSLCLAVLLCARHVRSLVLSIHFLSFAHTLAPLWLTLQPSADVHWCTGMLGEVC